MNDSTLVHIDQVKNLRMTNVCIMLEKLKAEWEVYKKEQEKEKDQESLDDADGPNEMASLPVNRD